MQKILFFIFLFLGTSRLLSGQQDSTLVTLPAVLVYDFQPEKHGIAIWTSDSNAVLFHTDAANRLRWNNVLQVRSNGPGLLSTGSIRGAGPARTPVFWNGLNLQSPMNGVYDLSLMPLWPGDRLEIRTGGQSAALSSGAMSGSLQIRSDTAQIEPGVHGQAGIGMGSFGAFSGQAGLDIRASGWRNRLRASWSEAVNNFPYSNTTLIGAPVQRQQNNRFNRLDVQHISVWKERTGHEVETAVWWQRAYRQLPPGMTEAPVESWQRDNALRASVGWRYAGKDNQLWSQQLGWMDERLVFNRSTDTDSSHAQTLLWRGEYTRFLSSGWTWRFGWQTQYLRARADGYSDTLHWQNQGRLALSTALEKLYPNWKWTLLLRQEWAQDQGAPFTWSMAGTWKMNRNLELRGQAGRNVTLPTFNDRFWQGLGKPDLQPEHGYSAHLYVRWHKEQRSWRLQAESGVFHLLLDNWILWQPGSDGLFRPDNLRQVWSRGIETEVSGSFHTDGWQLHAALRHQFTSASNRKVYGGNTLVLNKQLPYTPQHNASVDLSCKYGRYTLQYIHQWTAARFTTSDNSQLLPGFDTAVLLASCKVGQRGYFHLRLDNCWNEPYQMVAFRPMPGRNWSAGYLQAF